MLTSATMTNPSEREPSRMAPDSAKQEANKMTTGRIWCGPEPACLKESISKWPSLGHYLLHKLSVDNANDVIVVSVSVSIGSDAI
jgi:hypothetical protein